MTKVGSGVALHVLSRTAASKVAIVADALAALRLWRQYIDDSIADVPIDHFIAVRDVLPTWRDLRDVDSIWPLVIAANGCTVKESCIWICSCSIQIDCGRKCGGVEEALADLSI